MDISIRQEKKTDYREVEDLTREAFWNLYFQGCDEHYLVHTMRTHKDFIPELDLVAVHNGKIVGNIMYAKSFILDESNNRIETISFGPISVLPEYQRQGIGSALINHSKKSALKNNHKVIIILGAPKNYCKHGFKSSRDFNISDSEGKYPYGQLLLELEEGILKGHSGKYYTSDIYEFDANNAEEFDKHFKFKKKEFKYSQEEFSIAFRAYLK